MKTVSGSSSSRFLIILPMKYDAAVWELEGPCMTGPKTSLNMLIFLRIVYNHRPNVTCPHILGREFKIAREKKRGKRRELSPLGAGFESHRARALTTGKKPLKNLRTFFNLFSRNRDLISVQMFLSR